MRCTPGSSTCAVAQPLRMRDSIHVARCESAILCELQHALGSSATVSIETPSRHPSQVPSARGTNHNPFSNKLDVMSRQEKRGSGGLAPNDRGSQSSSPKKHAVGVSRSPVN